MTPGRRKLPRWVLIPLKLAVVAAVVAWMFHSKAIQADQLERALENWPLLLLALAAALLGMLITVFRWQILLAAQGIRTRWLDLWGLSMTGHFFTLVAPGGLGGDAVKVYYLTRRQDKKTEAATTVFLDRFLGLVTLFLVAGVMAAAGAGRLGLWSSDVEGLNRFGIPGGRVLILSIAGFVAATALFAALTMTRVGRRLLAPFSRYVPFRATATKIYNSIHLYGNRPGALAAALAVSVVSQIPLYLMYYIYGVAVGADVRLWHCALIVPPAMVIRILPLVPGGAGQGMVAMGLLFPLVGVEQGATIGALGDTVFVIAFLIGGLFFLFGRTGYREVRSAVQHDAIKSSEPDE